MSVAATWISRESSPTSHGDAAHGAPWSSLLRRVSLWVDRRSAWLSSAAHQSHASAFGEREHEQHFYDESSAARAAERELVATAPGEGESRLRRLASALELSEAEFDTLALCVALALEPRLGALFAQLRGDTEQCQVSEVLVAELTRRPLPLLSPTGGLSAWNVVRRGESERGAPAPLTLDPYILELACGGNSRDPELAAFITPVAEVAPLRSWPVQQAAERVSRALARGTPVRVTIRGHHGSGRASLAALIARRVGLTPLAVDTTRIRDDAWPNLHFRARRQARLTGAALLWRGAMVGRLPPPCPAGVPLELVAGDVDLSLAPERGVIDEALTMPSLALDECATLFRDFIPEASSWGAASLEQLVARHRVQIGDIVGMARRGVARLDDAREACRAATRERLGELAQRLECPFERSDLMLPPALDAHLDDLLFEARERARFWEAAGPRRLFPRGRGLVALMAGPPGTGKTMAAQVIAAELGLDLFRIDLASVVSKYIGETAKNLRSLFARAAEMSAVLLFDEADALFSKRTEVRDSHDRYANADTNYLLQQLEEFEGIALLASNKFGNMDAAFTRRIRYVLEFRPPQAAERLALWRRTMAEIAGETLEQAALPQLRAAAELVELSGAQIKLAVLGAVLISRRAGKPLRGEHLCIALQRELAKQGRALGERERVGIERHDR
jgi:hypothetical protein